MRFSIPLGVPRGSRSQVRFTQNASCVASLFRSVGVASLPNDLGGDATRDACDVTPRSEAFTPWGTDRNTHHPKKTKIHSPFP